MSQRIQLGFACAGMKILQKRRSVRSVAVSGAARKFKNAGGHAPVAAKTQRRIPFVMLAERADMIGAQVNVKFAAVVYSLGEICVMCAVHSVVTVQNPK